MEVLLPIFVVLAIIGVGFAIYYGWKAEQQRKQVMADFATRLGWHFDPEKDPGHDDRYGHFEIFNCGHSRAAFNTLSGELELFGRRVHARAGDYLYKITTSNGKTTTTHTHRFSYLIVHLPFVDLPDLRIRPEHIFDKLAGAFGFDDIDFESEEFSRRFHVKSSDTRFAYDVIHARMMEFLLDAKPVAIDIEQTRCCLSDGSRRWKPEAFEEQMDMLTHFFGHWPEHLTTELLA